MTVIDPLEAVLALAKAHTGLMTITGGRIAGKHRFAVRNGPTGSWKTPAKALVIRYDVGGTQEIYLPNQCVRLSAECYGEDEAEAGKVYTEVVALFRVDQRRVATTSKGNALIYWINPDGTPLSSRDEDIQSDLIAVPLNACVAEEPV